LFQEMSRALEADARQLFFYDRVNEIKARTPLGRKRLRRRLASCRRKRAVARLLAEAAILPAGELFLAILDLASTLLSTFTPAVGRS
jgi:hypothetical protein